MRIQNLIVTASLLSIFSFSTSVALAGDETAIPVYQLKIKDHKFDIETLNVVTGAKFKLVVINEDASAEEFESKKLRIEKMITPMGKLQLTLGPLKPGEYEFVGEFHEATAKGKLIVQ